MRLAFGRSVGREDSFQPSDKRDDSGDSGDWPSSAAAYY